MKEHYYSRDVTARSQEQQHQIHVADTRLTLLTDHGVFSKTQLDYGSRVLLEAVRHHPVSGAILDMGCGYGPIGIALAKWHPQQAVHMVDVNPRALDLAQRNAVQNGAANCVVYPSAAYAAITKTDFDLIVSNPPIRAGKDVVFGILSDAWHHLQPHGSLVVVIQKKQGAPSVQKRMEEVFHNVRLLRRDKGYWVLCSEKQ